MAVILCLAHYCDTHGPTPLMVTEGLPVPCYTCPDDLTRADDRRPSVASQSSFDAATLRMESNKKVSREDDARTSPSSTSASAIETPPASPRLPPMQPTHAHRRDSSFRKTYDENDRRRAVPCENCALTLPQQMEEQIPDGAPGSPMKNSLGDKSSPVLRTRKAFERIPNGPGAAETVPAAKTTPTDSDDSEGDAVDPAARHPRAQPEMLRDASGPNSHTHPHFLDFTSTHDPLSASSFSILRQSCLRTLSCETLPPSSNMATVPTAPAYNPFASLASSTPISTSGGPIFFGDPLAGYTTAYIFRIPDPYARGRRRVYALMALSTQPERTAMRVFSILSPAFRELAYWIQALAEQEADRQESMSAHESEATGQQQQHPQRSKPDARGKTDKKLHYTPSSSFLTGRTLDPDGFSRKGLASSLRSRGLAEIVGRADFFIHLHARFVALLAQLRIVAPS